MELNVVWWGEGAGGVGVRNAQGRDNWGGAKLANCLVRCPKSSVVVGAGLRGHGGPGR